MNGNHGEINTSMTSHDILLPIPVLKVNKNRMKVVTAIIFYSMLLPVPRHQVNDIRIRKHKFSSL